MVGLPSEKTDNPKGLLSNLSSLKAETKDDKFSLLLKSFSFGKPEDKALPEGLEKLGSLLQSDKKVSGTSPLSKLFALGHEELKDEEQIQSDILKLLPAKDFKQNLQQLIGEAKSYLKEQISQKTDLKELPKSLGGLIKLAEKSGIDVRAISFESLPDTAFTEGINTGRTALQTQNTLPHSTSQLVKPALTAKEEKEDSFSRPLNSLLNRENAELTAQTPKTAETGLFNASLNTLLHGENAQEEELTSKIEGEKSGEKTQLVQPSKTEQLSAKIAEAKQLVQHVAQSMKESVENYKPPFTRIKMQLNPQKFGEMDVTLIQRGNNVHININANSTALTVMMQNAHELKTQLSAQGLNDASMNFSSHQQQQGEQQKHENAHLSYEEYQEYEEEFTEIATALEIVVPRYI